MEPAAERLCLKEAQKQLRSALSRAKEAKEMRDKVPAQNRSEIIFSALAVHTWITDEFAPDADEPDPPDVELFKRVERSETKCDPFYGTKAIIDAGERVDEHTRERDLGIYGDPS